MYVGTPAARLLLLQRQQRHINSADTRKLQEEDYTHASTSGRACPHNSMSRGQVRPKPRAKALSVIP